MQIWMNSIGIGVLSITILVPSGCAQHRQDVDAGRIKTHVRFLSDDLLEGRGVGTRGGELTEKYIAAQMAAAGVQPGGENGTYFQTVPMVGVTTKPDSELNAIGPKGRIGFVWQKDFVAASHRQKAVEAIQGELVFVGHGIRSQKENWDDYKTDVRGKIVVVFTNEPQPSNPAVFGGKALTYAGRWVYKFEEAARQGALGCLIIHTTPTAGYGWEVVRNSWSKEDPQMKLETGQPSLALAGWLTEEAGNRLLGMAGRNVAELLAASDSRDFQPVVLPIRLKGELRANLREIVSRNVMGIVRGTGTKAKDEWVLFGAHWDHLGIALPVGGDSIYNGAIDNGTGCGIVLEIARAWAALETKPRRSAMFAFWTAEESGLRGAEYFSRHPLIPPKQIAINLNYDALFPSSRTADIVVTGAERTTAYGIVQEAARRYDYSISPDPRPEQGSYYRSDHFMLARIGIPAFSIKTGSAIADQPATYSDGIFADYNSKRYHQPSDEFQPDWDFASIEYAAKFGFLIGLNVANSPAMPQWNTGDEFAVR